MTALIFKISTILLILVEEADRYLVLFPRALSKLSFLLIISVAFSLFSLGGGGVIINFIIIRVRICNFNSAEAIGVLLFSFIRVAVRVV